MGVKPCPFCGTSPEVVVRAYYWSPNHVVRACVRCPACRPESNIQEDYSVQAAVVWTNEEILRHVPEGLVLWGHESSFHPTTAAAAKSAARTMAIDRWQRRCKNGEK